MSWFTDRLKDVVHYTGMVENVTAGKTCDANTDNGKTFILADAAPQPLGRRRRGRVGAAGIEYRASLPSAVRVAPSPRRAAA